MMRVLFDSNVWISALLNSRGHPAKLLTRWSRGEFEVIVSPRIIEEIRSTLLAPRIARKYGITAAEIERFIELILLRTIAVFPQDRLRLCRDDRDDHLLEAALIGKAAALISRDDDLKRDLRLINIMAAFEVRILSVNQFQVLVNKQ